MKKFVYAVILALSGFLFLTACGANEKIKTETKESSSAPSPTEFTLSEALPEYKIWYYFGESEVTKESQPSMMFYFDGKNVETYTLDFNAGHYFIQDEIAQLSISQILKITQTQQLVYAKSFFNIKSVSNTDLKSGNHEAAGRSAVTGVAPKTISPFKINIIKDETANRTISEIIKFKSASLSFGTGPDYIWDLYDGEILVESPADYTELDSHFLYGYATEYGGRLLTEVDARNVTFTLDKPSSESEYITVDEEDEKPM